MGVVVKTKTSLPKKRPRDVALIRPSPCQSFVGGVSTPDFVAVGSPDFNKKKRGGCLTGGNVCGTRWKEARPEPQRASHGAGKRRLQQPFLPGGAAVGPGQRGETSRGRFGFKARTVSKLRTLAIS